MPQGADHASGDHAAGDEGRAPPAARHSGCGRELFGDPSTTDRIAVTP
ncbi:hypothetical protein RAJCM14343_3047 [Rhodococcus aetherivorans]|uniref:Uncharacterized protein n=1 Tax=Rhodococcus aetherivorans TaxID=191292 RepID=A0ABQ0YMH9_9NOCA|nr:hypothetical protein RAJCM14343_3047 [Rhodococcus aetherivorans]CCW13006.1 hypothetical protein EBESD8_35590 [Rhodococcus aetherivorans]